MVQVENEVGVIPEARDFSPAANAAFAGPVPRTLVQYLEAHSDGLSEELRGAWFGAGKKANGSWEEVFGKSPLTADLFMAWRYATYIDSVAAAGKSVYALPLFANAALVRPNYLPGQYNSGGPLPHSIDIYRAGAPHLDFLCPDIYFDNFAEWARRYHREGNAVFVPEAKGGAVGAANALYVVGQLGGLGFSPFGIEGGMSLSGSEKPESIRSTINHAYAALSHVAPLILGKQGSSEMGTVLLEGEAQRSGKLTIGGYVATVVRSGTAAAGNDRVAVLVAQTGRDQFLVIGSGPAQVSFAGDSGASSFVGIASIDEEVFVEGKWGVQRRLNGDENGQGQLLRVHPNGLEAPTIYRVRLYRY
jgi:hypothetical protein